MLQNYLPILIFIGVGLALGAVIIILGSLMSVHIPNQQKSSAYECGFEAFESGHIPFDVRYYLVAILFILFDLETAFFFPWAVALRHLGVFGLLSMGLFLGVLVIGFIFEWKKGALEWE